MIRSLCLAVALLATLAACGDDSPTGPRNSLPAPTLDNVWPHEDGRSWTYDLQQRHWTATAMQPELQWPSFDLDDVDSVLAIGAPFETVDHAGIWRLKFDGSATTESGVTGQWLDERLYAQSLTGPVPVDVELGPARLARLTHGDGVLGRRRIESVEPPLLLHGYVWAHTGDAIGSYGDLDTGLAWKFLEADLSDGHRFTHQLVPAITDDVFLHVEVRDQRPIATEIGRFGRGLRVNYLVDLGEQTVTGEGGESLGVTRSYVMGVIVYVPTVGPAFCFERTFLAGDPVSESPPMIIDRELLLIGTGLEP